MSTAAEALRLAGGYVFGTDPGRLPALLCQALQETEEAPVRARLAAALARLWSFAGEPERAIPFAASAREDAARSGDAAVLADALDACLAAHWGVDEIDVRRELARELDDVTAHLLDPEARLHAHVWLLTCASERLDIAAMNRQMRALEVLAEDNPRAMAYAASRRLMLDLLRGRLDTFTALLALEEYAQRRAPDPDGFMVLGTMRGYGAVITGDRELAAQIAAAAEEYGDTEGIVTLCAEAAWMWWGAGRPERARGLVERFDADVVAGLPRDFNYLLTVQLALDVALETGADRVVEALTPALLPYAGRAVINAGAVMFHGVTDDPLSRATATLGDHELSSRLRTSALSTYRRIGASWWRTRLEAALPDNRFRSMTLRRGPVDGWLVGRLETPIKDRRGLDYLHTLIAAPGRELHVGQLAGADVEQADLGPIADATALAAYRRRLRQLDDELDQADKEGDAATGRRAHTEQQALLRQIAAATGSGRLRTHGSTSERARVAVKKAITAALLAIAEADPDMAEHLRQHIDTGTYCRYRPSTTDPVTWRL